ncbi:M48 family metalloprotease [Azospirillum doebereinerae]|uniref:M48 family metalloprotease n=1 Tax=Azospirillum doebereinerae TaxID=92933 RepID=UPI00163C888C|nr:M48 family metalloprotease [Azospirillum doebereinerae]
MIYLNDHAFHSRILRVNYPFAIDFFDFSRKIQPPGVKAGLQRRPYNRGTTMRFPAVAAALLGSSLLLSGCLTDGLSTAAGSFMQAATVSDDDMAQMAAEGIVELDATNRIAPPQSPYTRRLADLTRSYRTVNGRSLNFMVYMKPEMNAFAMPNGSVRVNSGLMDAMTDDELKFVIGHEIGHVAQNHAKRKFQIAYATSGARQAVASQGGKAGNLAAGQLGGLLEEVVKAQFSQAEETESDEYGLNVAVQAKARPEAAVSALRKFGDGRSPDMMRQLLASHPAPEARAEHLRTLIAGNGGAVQIAMAPPPTQAPIQGAATGADPASHTPMADRVEAAPIAATAKPGHPLRLRPEEGRQRPAAATAQARRDHGGVFVHLASYNDDGFVDRVIAQNRDKAWLRGHDLSARRVQLSAKGTVVRLMAGGFGSLDDARRFCGDIRGSWTYCQPVGR